MNWGKGIVFAFIGFAGFIGYMVTRAFQEDFDLVTEDYYAREINYQQKLVKLANTKAKGAKVSISQGSEQIAIEFANRGATGTIEFYHPSRELFDKVYTIELKNRKQLIEKSDLIAGNYRVYIDWTVNGQHFLQESKLFVR